MSSLSVLVPDPVSRAGEVLGGDRSSGLLLFGHVRESSYDLSAGPGAGVSWVALAGASWCVRLDCASPACPRACASSLTRLRAWMPVLRAFGGMRSRGTCPVPSLCCPLFGLPCGCGSILAGLGVQLDRCGATWGQVPCPVGSCVCLAGAVVDGSWGETSLAWGRCHPYWGSAYGVRPYGWVCRPPTPTSLA